MVQNKFTFKQTRWSLNDLFASSESPEFKQALKDQDKLVKDFEAIRPDLTESITAKRFLEIMAMFEELLKLRSRIGAYAELLFAEDTQNQSAQTLLGRLQQMDADIENRVLFFSLWWKEISDTSAKRLLEASGDYRYWLEKLRAFKPFTLSEPEEKIINLKDATGMRALVTLYDSITNRYTFELKVNGKKKELTRGEIMAYVYQPDPDLRANAYQEMYRVYRNEGPILGQMYQTLARDWRNEQINLRGFKTPITARNLFNDIPDDVVAMLLDVCQKNAPIFQRYFAVKAKWLGIPRLRRYDIYAPVAKSSKKYQFNDATKMVLDAFHEYDPQFADLALRVFEQNHLDSEVRKGKRSGAFCADIIPGLTPWVLVNFNNQPEDVATLAHELGHSIHDMLTFHHSAFTNHPCLPLAETASTFGEMMLVDKLLKEESDEGVRRDMLFKQVSDSYATLMRQAFFSLFEQQAHDLINQGASVDDLSKVYFENLKTQFGDSLELGDEFHWEWVSIPHFFHTPFYVYAYTFGQLLVLALYQQYRQEGDAFKPRYKQILSAGGSESPALLLEKAGIDIHKSDFWQGGFNVIEGLVHQLEAMPIKK
jgi:oligoendopeptidase F